jgi:hypothetical protein
MRCRLGLRDMVQNRSSMSCTRAALTRGAERLEIVFPRIQNAVTQARIRMLMVPQLQYHLPAPQAPGQMHAQSQHRCKKEADLTRLTASQIWPADRYVCSKYQTTCALMRYSHVSPFVYSIFSLLASAPPRTPPHVPLSVNLLESTRCTGLPE